MNVVLNIAEINRVCSNSNMRTNDWWKVSGKESSETL